MTLKLAIDSSEGDNDLFVLVKQACLWYRKEEGRKKKGKKSFINVSATTNIFSHNHTFGHEKKRKMYIR